MENNEDINMGDETTKFCVSWVTIQVMKYAVRVFIQAWNCHRIPGPKGGISNALANQNSCMNPLPAHLVPSTQDMIRIHEEHQSHLQRDATYAEII